MEYANNWREKLSKNEKNVHELNEWNEKIFIEVKNIIKDYF